MNKDQFMTRLRQSLRWSFTEKEIMDVLADYEGFFTVGLSEGKNETQICAELGEPSSIATDLTQALYKKRPPQSIPFLRVSLSSIILFFTIAFFIFARHYINILSYIIVVVLLPLVLWVTVGGTARKLPVWSYVPERKQSKRILAGHIVFIALTIGFYAFLHVYAQLMIDHSTVLSLLPQLLDYIFIFLPVIIILMTTLAVIGFYKATPRYFTLITHGIGVVTYSSALRFLLGNISGPEHYYTSINLALAVYGLSLALTALFAWHIGVLLRRAE
jgi:hypothetical protein